MKRSFLLISSIFMLLACTSNAQNYTSQRPAANQRLFRSEAVESKIVKIQALLKNPKLAWMFANC